jgi:hypothetical protein
MNCAEARSRLPALLYGDLEPAAARTVRQHLAGCAACRAEYAGLGHVRAALDAVPVTPVQVDLPQLYQEVAARQSLRLRTWRRAALGAAAVAALVLVGLGLRLQVRVGPHELVLHWGGGPPAHDIEPPPPAPAPADPELERRLQLVSNLIHALADDLDARDTQQQEVVKRLQARVDALSLQESARWGEARRDIAALYAARFGPDKKGEESCNGQ